MKRKGLALACLVAAGAAGAALFAPTPKLSLTATRAVTPGPPSATIASPIESTAPVNMATARDPAPLAEVPKPSPLPPPQTATLAEPPPAATPIRPASPREAKPPETRPPEAKPPQAVPLEKVTDKEIRGLADARCGGRTMSSITVLPDGSVNVQC